MNDDLMNQDKEMSSEKGIERKYAILDVSINYLED